MSTCPIVDTKADLLRLGVTVCLVVFEVHIGWCKYVVRYESVAIFSASAFFPCVVYLLPNGPGVMGQFFL